MQNVTFRLEHQEAGQKDRGSSPSPEMFSFPGTPAEDGDESSEFEFGSCGVTPGSPSTPSDPTRSTTSPADQFFLNGRLLPHAFTPTQGGRASFSGRENMMSTTNLSRGTSVGSSSVSSKDYSLLSSRSNSTNSRGGGGGSTCSTCSSARTSSSEVSERRAFQKRIKSRGSFREQRNVSGYQYQNYNNYHQFGGASQRWQFISAAPVLCPSRSRRSGVGPTPSPRKKKREEREGGNGSNKDNEGFLQRMLRTFLETCMACHAMESQEKEFDLDKGSVLAN